MHRLLPFAALSLSLLLAGCASAPEMPPGEGPGVVAYDPAPPEGARTWQRPEWRLGDRFVLVRGGAARREFTVESADTTGYMLVDGDGMRMKRTLDLGNLGEWPAAPKPPAPDEGPHHALAPVDPRFHWPLWVGKRWRAQFIDKTLGGTALPIDVSYHVEDLDTVQVPAGTFQALRIVRTARLMSAPGQFFDRTIVVWYAPDIGLEVRQIINDAAVELTEWTRGPDQPAAAPGGQAGD